MVYSVTILMKTKCLMQDSKYYSKNKQMCFLKQTRGQTDKRKNKFTHKIFPKSREFNLMKRVHNFSEQ